VGHIIFLNNVKVLDSLSFLRHCRVPTYNPRRLTVSPACDTEFVKEAFRPAREHLETLIHQLHGDAADEMQHDQAEALIKKDGYEIMRFLVQGFLDVRARREKRMESIEGSDGVVRTQCRADCEKDLMTEFGEVVVRRKGYAAKGTGSLFPLDAALNLPEDKYSSELCLW
jgi:hypothetical protein